MNHARSRHTAFTVAEYLCFSPGDGGQYIMRAHIGVRKIHQKYITVF